MATNNKRVATKHIRDGIKSQYPKGSHCEICNTTEALEFHHYTTVSLLLKAYAKSNGISIATDEDVLAMRDEFYRVHSKELLEDTVTLCAEHHALLHKTYGKAPPIHTAQKQALWVKKRRDIVRGVTPTQTEAEDSMADFGMDEYSGGDTGFCKYLIRSIPLSDFKV